MDLVLTLVLVLLIVLDLVLATQCLKAYAPFQYREEWGVSRQAHTGSGMASLVLSRGPTRTREARRRASTAPARAAATLPRRPLRFKSRRPRHARPGSCVTWRARAAAAEAAGMGKGAAGLQEEDYRRRSGGAGRRTRRARMRRMPAPARARMVWGGMAGVRGCVACRRRPGPSKPREEHHPRASTIIPRTTAGWTKDHRGGGDVHGSPGLRHGES